MLKCKRSRSELTGEPMARCPYLVRHAKQNSPHVRLFTPETFAAASEYLNVLARVFRAMELSWLSKVEVLYLIFAVT
eukprot:3475891-Amphidinium_carterae.1